MQGMRVGVPFGDCMASGDGSLATPQKATTCRTTFLLFLPLPFSDFHSNTARERVSSSAVRVQKASVARHRRIRVVSCGRSRLRKSRPIDHVPARLEPRWRVFSPRSISGAGGAYPSFTSPKRVNAANPFRSHLVIRTFFSQNLNFYETKILREDKRGPNRALLDRPKSCFFTAKLNGSSILAGTVRWVD
jgi:hypothetical protein